LKQALITFLILFFVIPGMVLGYGYWHSVTHGSAYIDLSFETSDKIKKDILSKAEVFFIDSDGKILAKGIRDEEHNYVHLIHPEAGDCHEVAKGPSSKESRRLWQECFKKQSVWIPTWIKNVRQVQINHKSCSSKKIPVVISEHNTEWLLWWVPLPHVGGKPYSYFRLSIVVEENDCLR
jgi:hypothetical protein